MRLMRFKAGLSVPALATAMRVSVRTVFRWESGEYTRLPPEDVRARLAKSLDVEPWRVENAFHHDRA
ncbi:hypothetical protein BJF86_13385 [Serinicoccus sp. CNJ-927]|nr:hypothetical protein BJF86_13385 [Serinicoccus sp. CNJ-927]